MKRIDAHIHLAGGGEALSLLEHVDAMALNICIAGADGDDWRRTAAGPYRALSAMAPSRYSWVTSFDPPDYSTSAELYAREQINALKRDFAAGAVGCKIWKNIGMEARDPAGRYMMVDDPIFEPIFEWLETTGRTVVMHIGEPKACWEPLTPNSPHYAYYSTHPEWHMHGRTDIPDYDAQISSRDHILEKHPNLRVIGAHYGSMEYDLGLVARHLQRYPNFAVDTSARLADAAYQDRNTVRDFFMRHSDRILWGSDITIQPLPWKGGNDNLEYAEMEEAYRLEWEFFATDRELTVEGRSCRGLALPPDVLRKIFHDNACAWYGLYA